MDNTAGTTARQRIAQQAETAVANQQWSRLRFIGNRFERARCYRDCWFALAQASEATTQHQLPIWQGPDESCSGVLVLPTTRDLGDELRILRFIGDLKAHVAKVVVLSDPRLHPLLERSFPGVICCDPSESPPHAQLSHMAAQERLAYWFGSDEQQLQGNFRPLKAAVTAGDKPKGIGISWFSKSRNKTLPAVEDWASVLKNIRQPLQSLQYLEKPARIRALRELSDQRIRSSQPIDQMVDLDGFAAQVAGVRGVLTISNTTAHLAGALGVPCVVILDNGSITNWPDHGDTTPLYPSTRLIRRGSDNWAATLRRGWRTLRSLISPQEGISMQSSSIKSSGTA